MMQVYISHATEDSAVARALARRLSAAGFEPWMEDEQILPGDNWAKKQGEALENAGVMVVLVTPNAYESRVVRQEVQFALTGGRYEGRLLPVFVGERRGGGPGIPWILEKLRGVHIADNDDGWDRVVAAVRDVTH